MLRRRRRQGGKFDVYVPLLDRTSYLEARADAEVDELIANYGEIALIEFARSIRCPWIPSVARSCGGWPRNERALRHAEAPKRSSPPRWPSPVLVLVAVALDAFRFHLPALIRGEGVGAGCAQRRALRAPRPRGGRAVRVAGSLRRQLAAQRRLTTVARPGDRTQIGTHPVRVGRGHAAGRVLRRPDASRASTSPSPRSRAWRPTSCAPSSSTRRRTRRRGDPLRQADRAQPRPTPSGSSPPSADSPGPGERRRPRRRSRHRRDRRRRHRSRPPCSSYRSRSPSASTTCSAMRGLARGMRRTPPRSCCCSAWRCSSCARRDPERCRTALSTRSRAVPAGDARLAGGTPMNAEPPPADVVRLRMTTAASGGRTGRCHPGPTLATEGRRERHRSYAWGIDGCSRSKRRRCIVRHNPQGCEEGSDA